MSHAIARYVVVTPVRDEAAYIGKTVASMVQQTLLSLRWVVVNDGSTDGTGELPDECTTGFPWIEVVHRANRGHRAAGGGVMDAFYAGFARVEHEPWNFVVKLDGDLSFDPDYFQRCLHRFATEPTLGIAGGTVCALRDGRLRMDSVGDPPFHVRGATKIYRRQCWEKIAPHGARAALGHDRRDQCQPARLDNPHLCGHQPAPAQADRRSGRTLARLLQERPGQLRHRVSLGVYAGQGLAARSPQTYLVESAALTSGYVSGYLRQVPRQAGIDAIRYLRGQQLRRILLRHSIYG